jgi:hypothetical protein
MHKTTVEKYPMKEIVEYVIQHFPIVLDRSSGVMAKNTINISRQIVEIV